MKSVLDSKTIQMLDEGHRVLKSAKGGAGSLALLKRVYPKAKITRKKIEFIEFVRLIRYLYLKKGHKGVLLLTWSELAFLLKGSTFKESRGDIKNTFIKHVKGHISELVRLGTMEALPEDFRFCISPVPEEAFNKGWNVNAPSDIELDDSYKGIGAKGGYAGVYISVVENGSILMAYLNKNVRIGQKIVDNGRRVVEGAVAARLISDDTKGLFGLTSQQLLQREVGINVTTTHKPLSLPFMSRGNGNFSRLNDTQEN